MIQDPLQPHRNIQLQLLELFYTHLKKQKPEDTILYDPNHDKNINTVCQSMNKNIKYLQMTYTLNENIYNKKHYINIQTTRVTYPPKSITQFEEEAIQFGNILEEFTKLEKLSIIIQKEAQFCDIPAQNLFFQIANIPNLTHLSLDLKYRNNLTIQCLENFPLLENLKQLSVLKIKLGGNSLEKGIGNEGLEIISQTISKIPSLYHLKIYIGPETDIDSKGIEIFAQNLKNMENLERLSLHFEKIFIEDYGFSKLGNSIRNLTNLQKLSLKIEGTHLGSFGCKSLFEGIQQLNSSLKCLKLHILQGNFIKELGMERLLSSLKNLNKLKFLNINIHKENKIKEDQVQELIKFIKTIDYKLEINLKEDLKYNISKNQSFFEP